MKKVLHLMLVVSFGMALIQQDVAERRSSRGRKAAFPSFCILSDAQLSE